MAEQQSNSRVDEPVSTKRELSEILGSEIRVGLTELRRPSSGLFLSALSAGFELGFSVLVLAVVKSHLDGMVSGVFERILLANAYAVGFIFVTTARSELFTEHTTLAVLPVLHREKPLRTLIRAWGIIYAGNLLGGAVLAVLAVPFGSAVKVVDTAAYGSLATEAAEAAWWAILVGGVLAGWLMGLVSWLSSAARETISQIASVWLVTAVIGFAALDHSIVGSIEMMTGLLTRGVAVGAALKFILCATAGNIIGGALFAGIKYAHAIRSH